MRKYKKILLSLLFVLAIMFINNLTLTKVQATVSIPPSIKCVVCGSPTLYLQNEDKIIPATCTTDGAKYIYYRCYANNCLAKMEYKYETYKKLGHNLETTSTSATCTEGGKKVKKCTRSGCTYIKEETAAALGHNWKLFEEEPATCTTPQTKEYSCTRCSKFLTTTVTAALGHNWETINIVKPTCGEAGYIVEKCTRCPIKRKSTPATSQGNGFAPTGKHNYVNGVCTVCGVTSGSGSTGSTSTHYHTWKDATCEEPEKCTSCGQTSGNALGHNYNSNGICTRCGEVQSGSGEVLNRWDLTGNGLVGRKCSCSFNR